MGSTLEKKVNALLDEGWRMVGLPERIGRETYLIQFRRDDEEDPQPVAGQGTAGG